MAHSRGYGRDAGRVPENWRPQRGSNPCSSLERAGRAYAIVRARSTKYMIYNIFVLYRAPPFMVWWGHYFGMPLGRVAMAQSVRAPVEARARRLRLEGRKRPYWVTVEKGLAVGYHRPVGGGAGNWWVRAAVPGKAGYPYKEAALALADDHAEADGKKTLDWRQAQAAARAWAAKQTGDGPLTIAKACETYLDYLRERKSDRAAKDAGGKVKKHILPVLGAKLVSELTSDEVRRWHGGMVRGELPDARRQSRDSANRVLTILKAALNLAFRDGLAADDRPWRRVSTFKGVGEARKVILSPDELQRLLDACPKGLRELVAAGALTGARLGELTAAQVRDLDASAGTLRVNGKTGSREDPSQRKRADVVPGDGRRESSGRPAVHHRRGPPVDGEPAQAAVRRRGGAGRHRPGCDLLRAAPRLYQPRAAGGRADQGRCRPLRHVAPHDRSELRQAAARGPATICRHGRALQFTSMPEPPSR